MFDSMKGFPKIVQKSNVKFHLQDVAVGRELILQ